MSYSHYQPMKDVTQSHMDLFERFYSDLDDSQKEHVDMLIAEIVKGIPHFGTGGAKELLACVWSGDRSDNKRSYPRQAFYSVNPEPQRYGKLKTRN
jgi:hypothetical protein